MNNKKLVQKFNRQALKHEKHRRNEADNKWRRKVCGSAKGKTLEIAVGAGMNYAFLPRGSDYTGVDFSPAMLEAAAAGAKEYKINADFILSEIEHLSFPENTFDTILSTGTLCCYKDPVRVLNLLNTWCRHEGQILLLEHGLMNNKGLRWLQHYLNPLFLKLYGCHHDRDVSEIVETSKLQIVKHERAQLGSLYLFWTTPTK